MSSDEQKHHYVAAGGPDDPEDNAFDLFMEESTQRGGFHTRNNPSRPFHREEVTARKGPIYVRVSSPVITHGYLNADSDDLATLLVYDFRFLTADSGRRAKSAQIKFNFSTADGNDGGGGSGDGPLVEAMAPDGLYTLMATTQEETTKSGGELTAGVAAPVGVDLGATGKFEKTVSKTTGDSTTIVGYADSNSYGDKTGVEWTISENKTTETGLPGFVRTAVLLRRATEDRFSATFTVNVEVDWKSRVSHFFGGKTVDDPLLFDPEEGEARNKLPGREFDGNDLGSVDLDDLFDVTFHTTFDRAVKSV